MNISFNWLKRYIDLGMTPQQTADVLTSIGLETGSVEEVESIRGGLRGIVIGHVLTCVDHPDSDHLHITTVDLGDGNATQIVCGAPNVAAGPYGVVSPGGTAGHQRRPRVVHPDGLLLISAGHVPEYHLGELVAVPGKELPRILKVGQRSAGGASVELHV